CHRCRLGECGRPRRIGKLIAVGRVLAIVVEATEMFWIRRYNGNVFLSRSSPGVFSLKKRFGGGDAVDSSGTLVCLIIAENAEDEFFWSRLRLRRGTITLVGDAVTHDVVCILLKEDDGGGQDFVDDNRYDFKANALPQRPHTYGLVFECVCMWARKFDLSANALLQIVHLNGFSPNVGKRNVIELHNN
ncbi:unnamed protein product, partial [Heterotrigona itama]